VLATVIKLSLTHDFILVTAIGGRSKFASIAGAVEVNALLAQAALRRFTQWP